MKTFETYKLNTLGERKADVIIKAFNRLAGTLRLLVPPDDYQRANAKLEEAFFVSLHGMGSLRDNQK